MMRLSVSEARATLPDVLDRVAAGDEVTITRHGQPVAVLVRPDALRIRRAAEVATSLAAAHRLRAADAVHLATAVVAGADRFVTNNRRDFPETLTDIDVTYPDTLPDPSAG